VSRLTDYTTCKLPCLKGLVGERVERRREVVIGMEWSGLSRRRFKAPLKYHISNVVQEHRAGAHTRGSLPQRSPSVNHRSTGTSLTDNSEWWGRYIDIVKYRGLQIEGVFQ